MLAGRSLTSKGCNFVPDKKRYYVYMLTTHRNGENQEFSL